MNIKDKTTKLTNSVDELLKVYSTIDVSEQDKAKALYKAVRFCEQLKLALLEVAYQEQDQ